MALRHTTKAPRAVALAGVLGLTAAALAACGGGSSTADASGGSSGGSGASGCADYKTYGTFKGKTVEVFTSIVTPEDAPQKDSYKQFEKCTGITVKYDGNKDFETQLPIRVKSGTAPDIAYIPQPGLLATMVATGKVKEAPAAVSTNVDKFFGKDWRGYGSVGGKLYAAPLGANVKSFVWYSPKAFKDKGYEVPTTWDAMIALSDKIVKDNPGSSGVKPWCAGFGSGEATGWTGTDWLEDTLLRTGGADVYDQWVTHKIPFNDPQVATALARVASILKNPKYVNGGYGDVKTIASTTFQDGGQPILQGGCYLHRQASFYAANWPKGTKVAPDGDIFAFYLPTIDASKGKPVEGGGEFVTAFADRPEVQAFQTFLSSDTWANDKAKATPLGGWVSANKGLKVTNLVSPIDQLSAKTLQDPKAVFRFDGSDAMPSAVGAGSFWKGMTDWVTGKSDKATLDYIEQSWPK